MHPIAFQLGPLTVHWYGIMVAFGVIAGLWTASRRSLREGIPSDRIFDLGVWLIVGAFIGARFLYVVSYWREQFAGKPLWEIFMITHGGLVYYGGLAGAALGCVLYVRKKQLPLWKTADSLAPSIALGHALGRIGCLFTGCCYGRACSLPWAIRFPVGHDTHPIGSSATPVHPTQIYESLLNFGLYAFLGWLFRRKRFDGQVFATYLVCYAVIRSFVEFFRGDYPQYYFGRITPAHFVSLVILVAGLLLLRALPRSSDATFQNGR